jgi:plastocyanin
MRPLFCSIGVLLAVTTGVSAPFYADLHGTVRAGGRPERNAVVWFESPRAVPPSSPGKVVLDQRNSTFLPHVLAVRVGTTVEFPNNDRVFHNVFSFHNGKRFDLGLYPVGTVKRVTFDHPGLSRVFCNIHPNMAAYVMVVDTPYFAVSDERGTFAVRGIEPGVYTHHVWRPGRAELTGTTRVEPGMIPAIFEWP